MICVQTKEAKAKIVNNKYLPIIRMIPDELWDEFKKILTREKPPKTVGRPIIPYRKVLDGMLYVLRTGCQWKMLPKELIKRGYVLHIPTKKEKKRKVMNKNQKHYPIVKNIPKDGL